MSNYFANLRKTMEEKRKRLKERPVGIVILYVIGSGVAGDPKALYIFTDHDRYLINCGESVQKRCSEHHLKCGRMRHVFVTRATWTNIGGLPGVAMALRNQGATKLTVHGPCDLAHVLNSCTPFVRIPEIAIEHPPCQSGDVFEDPALHVTYARLLEDPTVDHATAEDSDDESRVHVSMCLAMRVVAGRRLLLPEVCARLGVPHKSSLLSQLKNGVDVTLDDGTVVRASQVTAPVGSRRVICPKLCAARGVPTTGAPLRDLKNGCPITLPSGELVRPEDVSAVPAAPLPRFLVLDVPSKRYINSLLQNSILSENAKDVCLIVHFTPAAVRNDPRYEAWTRRFPLAVHLTLGDDPPDSQPGNVLASVQQLQHHYILPTMFPLLHGPGGGWPTRTAGVRTSDPSTGNGTLSVGGNALMQYHLLPHTGIDRSREPHLNSESVLREISARPNVQSAVTDFQERVRSMPRTPKAVFPKVTFLGTGGAVPSALRNTAAIILEISDERCLLLDCAEGSVGQLVRLRGEAGLRKFLESLRVVFLSHPHADHVLGLPALLRARQNLLPPRSAPTLFVIAHKDIEYFVRHLHAQIQPLLSDGVEFISPIHLTHHGDREASVCDLLQVAEVRSCLVDHGRQNTAYALAVTDRHHCKITYSGDTQPCASLNELGANSTILIHEATLEDSLQRLAHNKRHSTLSDAVSAGREMGAKWTLLTHFSQRYARVPRIDTLNDQLRIGVAFDNMQVSQSDLPLLPLLLRPLRAIYHASIQRLIRKSNRHHHG